MKISLRKLIATVSGLAIAATLPVASMMASAEATPTLTVVADKTEVKAGDTITLSVNVAGVSESLAATNVGVDVKFDTEKLAASKKAVPGALNPTFNVVGNTAKARAVDPFGIQEDGAAYSITFTAKEDLKAGDETALSVRVEKFAVQAFTEDGEKDGKAQVLINQQDDYATITVKAVKDEPTPSGSNATPSGSNATPSGSNATPSGSNATPSASDATPSASDATPSASDATPSTSDEDTEPTDETPIVPAEPTVDGGTGTGSGTGAQTGESTTLFVLALVLMAGSAVALVGMKKKVFSK